MESDTKKRGGIGYIISCAGLTDKHGRTPEYMYRQCRKHYEYSADSEWPFEFIQSCPMAFKGAKRDEGVNVLMDLTTVF